MLQVWLIGHDPDTLRTVRTTLRKAGYQVLTAKSASQVLEFLTQGAIDIVFRGQRFHDMSGLDIAQTIPDARAGTPLVVVTGYDSTEDAAVAKRLGITDVVERPGTDHNRTARWALEANHGANRVGAIRSHAGGPEAHAAARWARAVVPIVDCPKDPRTIIAWGHWIAASPGAVRNWCSTAGIGPRRSLVFGRILRAVVLSDGGRRKPENLLDIVDRRTLSALLRLAGLTKGRCFPRDVDEFLDRQILVCDPDALLQIKRALEERHRADPQLTADARLP